MILEADFSQLEVIGLAALSNDPVLIDDLLAGRDMHTYYTAERLKIPESEVTPGERRKTKRMTFQLQYGAGADGMARKLEMTKEETKAFIEAYYTRYKRVKEWQDEVVEAVKRSRKPSERVTTSGLPAGRGQYESLSGRLYTFYEQDPPAWLGKKDPNFTPTQPKNYPVQGFATGDVMAVFRAAVLRWWLAEHDREFYLPNNTVHDSIMFDCYNLDYALKVRDAVAAIAEALPEQIENLWGIQCPVPFKIESKGGPNWAEMHKL